MKQYLLSFCTKEADILDNPENRMYWRCQAENYNHAVEQLLDAEPTTNYHELIKTERLK